jgi:hypothetical protein
VQNETRGQSDEQLWGGVRCAAHFAESAPSKKPLNITDRSWCEANTTGYIVTKRLPRLGFGSMSPAQPLSVLPAIPPPPPPAPAAPAAPPRPASPPPLDVYTAQAGPQVRLVGASSSSSSSSSSGALSVAKLGVTAAVAAALLCAVMW